MIKRHINSAEFKAQIAMEVISGRTTIQKSAANHAINPAQVTNWKRQLLDSGGELFTRGK